MTAPTVYKWTDASAPQITRGDVASYMALFQAVLIDGYGAKAAPGAGTNKWTIPFSDGNSFVLRQGGSLTKKACLKLHSFNAATYNYARQIAADNFTDLNTPVNQWAGVNVADVVGLGFAINATYRIPWIIIATERVLICQFGYNGEAVDVSQFDTLNNDSYTQNAHWYFGDYKSEEPTYVNNQCIIYPRYNSTQNQYYSQAFTSQTESLYSVKRIAASYNDSWIGEINAYALYTRPVSETSVQVGSKRTQDWAILYPSPLNGGLYLEKYRLVAHNAIMGELYGVLMPLQSRPFPSGGQFYTFAGQGDYVGEDLMIISDWNGQYIVRLGDWGVE